MKQLGSDDCICLTLYYLGDSNTICRYLTIVSSFFKVPELTSLTITIYFLPSFTLSFSPYLPLSFPSLSLPSFPPSFAPCLPVFFITITKSTDLISYLYNSLKKLHWGNHVPIRIVDQRTIYQITKSKRGLEERL